MTVLNPDTTNHEIKIIPRFYADGDVVLELQNEDSKEVITIELPHQTIDGYMYLSFAQSFKDNSNYRIKITQAGEVAYRGKLFVTNQTDLQDYKISKDVFTI